MKFRFVVSCALFTLFAILIPTVASGQQPNANQMYQQLRNLRAGGEVVQVSNLTLTRDAAVFTFTSGTIAFYPEVNGKDTGAVFMGNGHIHITPPTAEEKHNLQILNKTDEFDDDFDVAVLRFTDKTAAELRKAATGKGGDSNRSGSESSDFHNFASNKLHNNYDLRILEDVMSPAPGGYFLAAMHAHKNPHLLLEIDPHGANDVAPEEFALHSWNDWGDTILLAFHLAGEYSSGAKVKSDEFNSRTRLNHVDLDTTIEKSGFLTGLATIDIKAAVDGVAVIPMNLYKTLRVSKVEATNGGTLDFVQEKKEDDPDFGVILQKPLKKDETIQLKISYGGKDVVTNEGGSNYYPIARTSWYPNSAHEFGDYVNYTMRFHVPKGLELIATGTKTNESNDGKYTTSEWKSDVPIPVAGFSLGKFKMKEAQVPLKPMGTLTLDAYANQELPDTWKAISNGQTLPDRNSFGRNDIPSVGTINTVSLLPMQLSEATAAAEIYTDYFGEIPFSHVALTQQFACNYGQSWPMLVYIPICGFLDTTQQHFLGLHPEDMYWKVVTPHEVAHQWWGHTVGFRGYRDQWMSEGFADASAAQYLLMTRKKPDDYKNFWKEELRLITERNQFGFRPIDVGPVTMGYRLVSPKVGWNIYRSLVYPKGAFILHMSQQMLWTSNEGDARFKAAMHELIKSHKLQPITTEDFKAALEKFMPASIDYDHNHKLDWFFNEYVYGTALPHYHFEGSLSHEGDTDVAHLKITQSNVTPEFKMAVPVYVELEDGRIIRIGSASLTGNYTVDTKATLPKFPSPPKKLFINYYYDVLCTEN